MPSLPNHVDAFYSLNCDFLLVEYRGYGSSTGNPTIRSLIEDVKPIYDALGVPEEEITVMGRSIGTIAALAFVHAFPQVKSLVIESGMSRPAAFIAKCTKTAEADLQQHFGFFESTLRAFQGQLLLLHCTDDETFPTEEAMQNFAWSFGTDRWDPTACSKCKAAQATCTAVVMPRATVFQVTNRQLVLFDGGGHNYIFPLNWSVYAGCLQRFVRNDALVPAEAAAGEEPAFDGEWWSELQRIREEEKSKGRCAIS
jgi:pimeloyl-ACP methyl ester carboxylesterase